ncbi:MAG: hypothetical protein K8S99_05660 [Planctomycetes bacterium]|nr:hypothetical protein [Planctomycetota bacterium]
MRNRRTTRWLWVGAGVIALAAPALRAAEPSLDELLNITPSKPATQPAEQPESREPAVEPREAPGAPLTREVERILSGKEAGDLFDEALTEMKDASERLGAELDAGTDTQRLQQSVLAKLDRVIAAADAQQSQSSSSSSSSGKPREQDRGGQPQGGPPKSGGGGSGGGASGGADQQGGGKSNTGGNRAPTGDRTTQGADKAINEQRSEWGNLPARLRDQLLEGQNERFSPIYRELTEQYYKRLAEEKR